MLRGFRVKATDFTRQRVLSWQVVVVMMLRGHKVSLQTAVNKFFSALGDVWQVVTASAYRQARQKVQPEVVAHLTAVAGGHRQCVQSSAPESGAGGVRAFE